MPQVHGLATGGNGGLRSGVVGSRTSERPGRTLTTEQLGQGSIDRPTRRREKDYEALQYARTVQAHIPRTQAAEALATRECGWTPDRMNAPAVSGTDPCLGDHLERHLHLSPRRHVRA